MHLKMREGKHHPPSTFAAAGRATLARIGVVIIVLVTMAVVAKGSYKRVVHKSTSFRSNVQVMIAPSFPGYCSSLPARNGTSFSPASSSAALKDISNAVAAPLAAVYRTAQMSLDCAKQAWAQAASNELTPLSAHLNLSAVLQGTGPYPRNVFSGKGIVIVAGGNKYSPPAYACITALRRTGCTLPVEVWVPPHESITSKVELQFASLGAVIRQLGEVFPPETHPSLKKFVTKPAALLASSFKEILLLDSDNIPLRDPTYLFQHVMYTSHGLLMWQDFWMCQAKPSAWYALSIPPGVRPSGSHESGQVLIDKERGWQTLLLSAYLNLRGDVFYPMFSDIGQGDKETFPLSWLALSAAAGRPMIYGLVPFPVLAVGKWNDGDLKGYAMLQRGPEGGALFLHAHLPKVNLQVGTKFHRTWLNFSGGVAVRPPGVLQEQADKHFLINAVAGYDVEFAVHSLRQQLRCDPAWVECCLHPDS